MAEPGRLLGSLNNARAPEGFVARHHRHACASSPACNIDIKRGKVAVIFIPPSFICPLSSLYSKWTTLISTNDRLCNLYDPQRVLQGRTPKFSHSTSYLQATVMIMEVWLDARREQTRLLLSLQSSLMSQPMEIWTSETPCFPFPIWSTSVSF